MGAFCSRGSTVDSSPDLRSGVINAPEVRDAHGTGSASPPWNAAGGGDSRLHKVLPNASPARVNPSLTISQELEDFSFESQECTETGDRADRKKLSRVLSDKARTAKSKTGIVARRGAAKVNEMGSLLGRAGTAGFGKAVEALDILGSSMTNLNIGSSFAAGAAPKGNKIGILTFEVANTIVKGFNLKQSLSEENIKILKEEILRSEGVQRLVSTDTVELMQIAATDKRNELRIFSGEVVRFGNHCRDPQWHQLDRFFEKLGTEVTVPPQTKEDAEAEMQNLMVLAQCTAELYHEMHALDRFEMDYRRKLQEEELFSSSQRGDSLAILRGELKGQKKHVKNMKKRSLWSKILEEVMEKLVDVVYFLHQEIQNAFGDAADSVYYKDSSEGRTSVRLGAAGLSLHYANIINQIDGLVSRPSSVPPNARDNLYHGLPPNIKTALRYKLQSFPIKEEMSIPRIKAEMEKTLAWLVPIAANTTKAHHGFGWVGEWANTGSALDRRLPGHTELILLQTLHHADQKVTEDYILDLILWLHHLVSLARCSMPGNKSAIKSPSCSPGQGRTTSHAVEKTSVARENGRNLLTSELSPEDHAMLQGVKNKKFRPGISKSQDFDISKAKAEYRSNRLSKSSSYSPRSSKECNFSLSRRHAFPSPIDFEVDKKKALDVIDNI